MNNFQSEEYCPLNDYPRPYLQRDSFYCLNGFWDLDINQEDKTELYSQKILVPFSPECKLSGIEHILQPNEQLHYRLFFTLPEGFVKKRVLLHFEAVDQECKVWLNQKLIGEHCGGYSSFYFDITDHLCDNNELKVDVKDQTELLPYARGKQKLSNTGKYKSIFYKPQSGIWQSVWLESIDEDYITDLKIETLYDKSEVSITIAASNPKLSAEVILYNGTKQIGRKKGGVDTPYVFLLKDFEPWTPSNPHLYDIKIKYAFDEVKSYFGMRKISCNKDKNGIRRFFLNNKPFFFNGVLDQGYWPDSLMTNPSDFALIKDISTMKSLGFNTLRKHIKVENRRFYYHCDKLGMLVWQDMPNGGGNYSELFVTELPNVWPYFGRIISDKHYRWFKRSVEKGRELYYQELTNMLCELKNYTSIVEWTPFNEGWGQFDANKVTDYIKKLDNSRLINQACGWFDQHGGDMYSIHNYRYVLKVKPQLNRVVALTEYGGYAYPIKKHILYPEKIFGYGYCRSAKELTNKYAELIQRDVLPNIEKGLSAIIYTQLSDVEEEVNGLMTYDREVVKVDSEDFNNINKMVYRKFDELTLLKQ
ncbi:glycoside hydrolase family 2 TIM barrel-domain containing protein [Amygdalobacter indicium]|uniref:Glycoside hydrolase family 2 TIM barrel-domain containing protein n=1 Tax=Amygdalobacter indicium TaxID=3029272 RepID=A0ABY8C650_9FIRM|nr:glycoside hydrolase family 2 TIM barrel-domain containing protein [Amygdalobacter indicium]WEG35759.1 glycoside hydrolase family 2 TIM barrel-domain containing protein [Amygdalobacter indicium]